METLPVKKENPVRKVGAKDDRPKLGDWRWVQTWERITGCSGGRVTDGEGKTKRLLCVTHLASNHVVFSESSLDGGVTHWQVRYRDLERLTTPEPNWEHVVHGYIEEKKEELRAAVLALTDMVKHAGLVSDPVAGEPATLLPSTTRFSPEAHKRALIKLKDKAFPDQHKRVQAITQELTALHRDLYLPFSSEAERMNTAVKQVDDRLFALELYAGLFQQCVEIRSGEPAPEDTPVTVRQMLRYMDEECLIDYDKGGMDSNKLPDFDAWIAKDENLNRIAPEPRCVVALQVRRNDKDYGPIRSFADAMFHHNENMRNKKTYLLLRNGTQVYRLITEIEFSPRLIPYRDEFNKSFTKEDCWNREKEPKVITPDDLEYDEHVEKRLRHIFKYNRVMFLIQGLLDRSKVFAPHPPINLADQSHVDRWFRAVFDEELGLPSANPPKWEEYRDLKNAQITVGSHVWSVFHPESDYRYVRYEGKEVLIPDRHRDTILPVTSITRNRSKVRVSWPWGTRHGYEHGDWGTWGEWPVDRMRHCWIPMKECFNVSAYAPGDYKQFLCDAYLKGAYLEWAPQLLGAEQWHTHRKQ